MMTPTLVKGSLLAAATLASLAAPALAATTAQVSGQGALSTDPRRNFSVSAKLNADGTASGRATLINKAFTGENGKQPYMLQVDISCAKVLDDKTVIFGGSTKRTNDPSLVDAVYFSVQDNGEPGANSDKISRAYFFDDDPNTTGSPALCQGSTLADLPLETIVSGNIQVKVSQ
jgi:hypothetical protein